MSIYKPTANFDRPVKWNKFSPRLEETKLQKTKMSIYILAQYRTHKFLTNMRLVCVCGEQIYLLTLQREET